MRGGGVRLQSGSQPLSTAVRNAHGAQTNFGDLTPYLTFGGKTLLAETWKYFDLESAIKNAKFYNNDINFRSTVFVFYIS
jgi:hypothetical protein